jgi:hypothetical protein
MKRWPFAKEMLTLKISENSRAYTHTGNLQMFPNTFATIEALKLIYRNSIRANRFGNNRIVRRFLHISSGSTEELQLVK